MGPYLLGVLEQPLAGGHEQEKFYRTIPISQRYWLVATRRMAAQAGDTILLTKQDLGPIGETATVHKALMTDSCARICGFL